MDSRVLSHLSETKRNELAVQSVLSKGKEKLGSSQRTHPLMLLAKAVSAMNSTEFVLPPEMTVPQILPGLMFQIRYNARKRS